MERIKLDRDKLEDLKYTNQLLSEFFNSILEAELEEEKQSVRGEVKKSHSDILIDELFKLGIDYSIHDHEEDDDMVYIMFIV
tara:strand:+ start:20552 stop:20797 length:246 start_codon:yes stop_codon:yes gene_type:complete